MTTTELSFKELIVRAQAGDRNAFGVIYETHVTPLYRYVLTRTGVREEAEDIVSETFLRAYEALPRFEATRESFLPYLFTIARNLLINRSRKKRPEPMPHDLLDRNPGSEQTASYAELRELAGTLERAMGILTETEHEVVTLRFFGEQNYAEIALALEKKEDAVRQHVARAMKKLRAHMGAFQ